MRREVIDAGDIDIGVETDGRIIEQVDDERVGGIFRNACKAVESDYGLRNNEAVRYDDVTRVDAPRIIAVGTEFFRCVESTSSRSGTQDHSKRESVPLHRCI